LPAAQVTRRQAPRISSRPLHQPTPFAQKKETGHDISPTARHSIRRLEHTLYVAGLVLALVETEWGVFVAHEGHVDCASLLNRPRGLW
jgi:hypothetical protein